MSSKRAPQKLPPEIQVVFDRFIKSVNNILFRDQQWTCFYEFVRACRYRRYTPHETRLLLDLLCQQGVPEEKAKDFVRIFRHCYNVLGASIPLNVRSRKLAEHIRNSAAIKKGELQPVTRSEAMP
jgi:hypothetical protein